MSLLQAKLALALVGIATWGWGVRTGDPTLRWVGIALIGAAVLLRFVRPKRPELDSEQDRP